MTTTLQELLAKQEALVAEIAEVRKTARAEAIAKVRALMAENGLIASDIEQRPRSAATGAGKGSSKGTKVAVKYQDKATGESWTGRGLQPKWLKAKLASGSVLSDFAV